MRWYPRELRGITQVILNIYESVKKKYFLSLQLICQSGPRVRIFIFSKQAAKTTAPVPPPT